MNNEKLIIVGSTDSVETSCVRKALIKLNRLNYCRVVGHATKPYKKEFHNRKAIILNADNLALECRNANKHLSADIFIGIDSGVYYDDILNEHYEISYVSALTRDGKIFRAASSQFKASEEMMDAILENNPAGGSMGHSTEHAVKRLSDPSAEASRRTLYRIDQLLQPTIYVLGSCF